MKRARPTRLAAAVGVACALGGPLLWLAAAAPAGADGSGALLSYRVAVQAPLMQVTYDNPQANFHPQGEGEVNYALATLDATRSEALSSVLWPGGAAGNAGSLLGVLGYPTITALNDPLKADVSSGNGPDQQTLTAPSGTVMSASVRPAGPGQPQSAAKTTSAGTDLGPAGSIGSSSASSNVTMTQATGAMVAKATSTATDISLGGVLTIGSFTSQATTTSTGGSTPKTTNSTVFTGIRIAGQPAYVDGSGMHVGTPGHPANPAALAAVNSALAGTGMKIFFTAPYQFTIASLSYNYAASILIYWAPPEPNHDVSSFSFGGAAIAMEVTPGLGGSDLGLPPPLPGSGSSMGTPVPPPPVPATQSLPSAPPGQPTPPAPSPSGVTAPTAAQTQLAAPISATSPGVGAPWFMLVAVMAALGALFLPRVPALLKAESACPHAAAPPRRS